MKRLDYSELINMVGKYVVVKMPDRLDQKCEVQSYVVCDEEDDEKEITMIQLESDDFYFTYDKYGNCEEDEFEVFLAT